MTSGALVKPSQIKNDGKGSEDEERLVAKATGGQQSHERAAGWEIKSDEQWGEGNQISRLDLPAGVCG